MEEIKKGTQYEGKVDPWGMESLVKKKKLSLDGNCIHLWVSRAQNGAWICELINTYSLGERGSMRRRGEEEKGRECRKAEQGRSKQASVHRLGQRTERRRQSMEGKREKRQQARVRGASTFTVTPLISLFKTSN